MARKGFWAQDQAQCTPYAILQPSSAQDVAGALRILRETGCPFAIKSGGHGRCEGESSITAGVLIDLKRLDKIVLSENKRSCKVGPGSIWKSVYSLLNPQGLTVIGGRASTVGVGGFVISGKLPCPPDVARDRLLTDLLYVGGISFFSNRHGWALDNVLGFEVVLADGTIVIADQSNHADLYKALRGGGANFGIVTDLSLAVHPYEGMWGGSMNWAWEHGDALIDAFINYGHDNVNNVDAAVIFGAINYKGQWVWHCDIENLKPTPPAEDSPLQRYKAIPTFSDLTGPTSQIGRTEGIIDHYPPGSYNGYWTFCTEVDKRIIKFFFETWREEIDPLLHIDGLERAALADINFVSQNIVDAMSRNGGNALGLAGKGPFLLLLLEPYWIDGAHSHTVWKALSSTATRTQTEAKRLGLSHEYVYLNYANPFQDVYAGYGYEAKAFLATVSAKYDPSRIFQTQRGAGWNLRGTLLSKTGVNPLDGVCVTGKDEELLG